MNEPVSEQLIYNVLKQTEDIRYFSTKKEKKGEVIWYFIAPHFSRDKKKTNEMKRFVRRACG